MEKWWIEEITGRLPKRQQVALFELTICPLHRFFLLECTDNLKTVFNIERSLPPFLSYELIGVSGTVGRGMLGRFHEKHSLRTFVEHLVCQNKFAKEGKFFNF
jgi:hypothetical protein